MGIYLRITVAQVQLLDLDLFGGATESIFPEVEAYLQADHDHQKAIEWVAKRKDPSRYRSVMDFLFCETFPEYKFHCFKFYRDGGDQLRHIITVPERTYYAWHLLQMIEAAYRAYSDKRQLTWAQLLEEVRAA